MFDINLFTSSAAKASEGFWDKVLPTLFTSAITTGLSVGVTIWIFTRNNRKDKLKTEKEQNTLKDLIKVSIQKTIPVIDHQINTIKEADLRLADHNQNDFTVTVLLFGIVEPVLKLPAERIFDAFSSNLNLEESAEKYDDYISSMFAIPPLINQLMKENEEFAQIMHIKSQEFNVSYVRLFELRAEILLQLGETLGEDPFVFKFFKILHNSNSTDPNKNGNIKFIHDEIILPIINLYNEFQSNHYRKTEIIQHAQIIDFKIRDIFNCKEKYRIIFNKHIPILEAIKDQLTSIELL